MRGTKKIYQRCHYSLVKHGELGFTRSNDKGYIKVKEKIGKYVGHEGLS